jgi:deoxyribodipyrimidine photolyase
MESPIRGTLPPHLAERTIALNDRPIREDGAFVLCWLHHAVRDHENPALDAAIEIANSEGKPVLVYQGLGGAHRFNADRHHRFILEGARDLARGLRARGVAYAFHLPVDPAPRTGGASPIRGLIERAAAVVTEDFPAPPFPAWAAAHAARAPGAFLAVDAACVMPLRLLGERHERAFKFRDAAKKQWDARLRTAWADSPAETEPLALDGVDLGFEPVDLETADLDELCAGCLIDHSVPPVGRAEGGSVAGYARWESFRADHLARYDKARNNATSMEAVSCLSPYLHHGHVSPFRIARDARAFGGSGAEKFLDELLVWRELAHNFCAFTDRAA